MDTAEITKRMKTQWAGRPIVFFDRIASTNVTAGELGDQEAPEGTLVLADCQTGGKGRRGRCWFSPPGTGIWMTLLLRPKISAERVPAVTLVAALSVCRAVRDVTGLDIRIKWPNDLVTGGRKICGILTETRMDKDRIRWAAVGIGINVNQTEFPDDLPYAYSLALAAGHPFSREDIIARVWECFEDDYGIYLLTGDMSGLKQSYEANLANLNQQVRVLCPSGEWEGTALGIDECGDLLVSDGAGKIHAVNSGEVSVRGIYDYVH